jgi:hypothetical protein
MKKEHPMSKAPKALIESLEANGYKHVRGNTFSKNGESYFAEGTWSDALDANVWTVKKSWLLMGLKAKPKAEAAE